MRFLLYGVYFARHDRKQARNHLIVRDGVRIGLANIGGCHDLDSGERVIAARERWRTIASPVQRPLAFLAGFRMQRLFRQSARRRPF